MKGRNALQAAGAMVKHVPFACANARLSSDATIFLAKASNARKISSKCSNARNARFASLAFLAFLAKDKDKAKDKAKVKDKARAKAKG